MHILITGRNGQVGSALIPRLGERWRVTAVGRSECDLSRPDGIRRLLAVVQPDVIVNAAAYTSVDGAESDRHACYAINAEAPGLLADEARKSGALLVHYSTDYVFDGRSGVPYTERDAAHPVSVYGMSKLAGEDAVRGSGCRHLILRTSWVFSEHGRNFLKTMLGAARTRKTLSVVDDQAGSPTSAAFLADSTTEIVGRYVDRPRGDRDAFPFGTYHLACAGYTTWCEYARTVVETAERCGVALQTRPDAIVPICTADYPTAAARPLNSCLDTTLVRQTFRIPVPPWQREVIDVVNRLANHENS